CSLGKHAWPVPQSSLEAHSAHRPSTQEGAPDPQSMFVRQSTQPRLSLHPNSHLFPPIEQSPRPPPGSEPPSSEPHEAPSSDPSAMVNPNARNLIEARRMLMVSSSRSCGVRRQGCTEASRPA